MNIESYVRCWIIVLQTISSHLRDYLDICPFTHWCSQHLVPCVGVYSSLFQPSITCPLTSEEVIIHTEYYLLNLSFGNYFESHTLYVLQVKGFSIDVILVRWIAVFWKGYYQAALSGTFSGKKLKSTRNNWIHETENLT